MKKSKRKFVLVGLFLLAAIITGLTLTGCETEVDPSTPQQEQPDGNTGNSGGGNTQQPGGENGGNEDEVGGEKPVTYTVTFNANGGAFADSSTTKTQVVENGKVATKPENPTKTDYDFGGWYTSENGGTTLADTAYNFEAEVTQDITLYAKWGVASVRTADNTNTYDTFDSALAAAMNSTGSTLTLLTDINRSSSISVTDGDFTLDLNGHTISGESDPLVEVSKTATLTITDSSQEKKGAIDSKIANCYTVYNEGTLTVNGGNISATGMYGTGVFNELGTLTVSGGSISATAEDGYSVNTETSYFHLSGNPTFEGKLCLNNSNYITLVGELTGTGTYAVESDGIFIAVGGSTTTAGAVYQITESDKGKFTVDSGTLELRNNQICWL